MKKLSKIQESVWGDLHSRGIGEIERAEDDVNHLDRKGLYDYITDKYRDTIEWSTISVTAITIEPKESNIYISLKYDDEKPVEIVFGSRHCIIRKPLMDKLNDRFNFEKINGQKKVTEKDGTFNNKTYVDFITLFMDNIDDVKLQESVWGDLHSRGIGEVEREEDNVNLLDKDEFFKYVMSHYEVTRDGEKMSYNRSMCVPILKIKGERRYAIILNHLAGYVEAHFHLEKCPEVYSALEKKFNVDSISHYGNSYLIEMKDKNVNQINQFFLDVIDTIIENAEFPILRKKNINESVWADLHSRGIGETEREEDNVNLLDKDGFFDYLTKHYIIDAEYYMFKDAKNAIVIPYYLIKSDGDYNFIYYYTDNNEVSLGFKIEEISPNLTRKLKETYATSYVKHQFMNDLVVKPKNGEKSSNKFLLEVMDFLIDNTPKNCHCCIVKKNINESVWADLHSRGIGDTVREEDDHKFRIPFEEIQKIPDSELFPITYVNNEQTLWTPYNFGAKNESEPGLYLDGDELLELAEYLNGTEYHMATQADWTYLNALSKYHYDYTKINGYWTYVFSIEADESKKLYVPNFGYISSWFARHPEEKAIIESGKNKKDMATYGWVTLGVPARNMLKNNNYFMKVNLSTYSMCYQNGNNKTNTDRLQVRLVKTPGKTWKFNKS